MVRWSNIPPFCGYTHTITRGKSVRAMKGGHCGNRASSMFLNRPPFTSPGGEPDPATDLQWSSLNIARNLSVLRLTIQHGTCSTSPDIANAWIHLLHVA